MTALLLPLFASLLSISIVNVALPAIEADLDASSAALQWVLSGYALAFGMALVPAGRAGDLWDRRYMFLLSIVVFGVSSLAAGLATTGLLLNIARVFMGFAAGMLTPQVIGMIQQLYSGSARGRAYGLMGTVIGVGVAAGPTLGGVLIDLTPAEVGWRLTFIVNVPITAVALTMAIAWLPRGRPAPDAGGARQAAPAAQEAQEAKDAQETQDVTAAGPVTGSTEILAETVPSSASSTGRRLHRLDPIGIVLLASAVVLVMLPFIQFRSLLGAGLAVVGAALLLAWVFWERRLGRQDAEAPMVNLALFTVPSYTLNSLVLLLYFTGMPAIWAIIAIYVQQGLGHGALAAGLVTLPSAVMVMLLSSPAGKRAGTRGPQMLVAGTALAVMSMAMLAVVAWLIDEGAATLWIIGACLALVGVSQALIIPSAQTLSMQDVPEHMAGAAGGVAQTGQRVFTAIGIAIVTGAYFSVTPAHGHQAAMVVAVALIAVLMLSSILAAVYSARRAQSPSA